MTTPVYEPCRYNDARPPNRAWNRIINPGAPCVAPCTASCTAFARVISALRLRRLRRNSVFSDSSPLSWRCLPCSEQDSAGCWLEWSFSVEAVPRHDSVSVFRPDCQTASPVRLRPHKTPNGVQRYNIGADPYSQPIFIAVGLGVDRTRSSWFRRRCHLTVRIPPSQGGYTGSIPVSATKSPVLFLSL